MVDTPFWRLARVHALSTASDAMITIALAGSLFFSRDPSAARGPVALYLILTMAPFAVVAPLIGPALDRVRGGRRRMIIAINLARTIFAILMISNVDSLWLYPIAFALLVLQKSYGVAKASVVPSTVTDSSQLVSRNARLALVGSISGFVGAGPALLANLLGGSGWVVGLATVTFALTTLYSFRLLPAPVEQEQKQEQEEVSETPVSEVISSPGIRAAASATGMLRAVAGFMAFMVAFAFRGGADEVDLSGVGTAVGAGIRHAIINDVASDAEPVWKLLFVAGAGVAGFLLAALLAPRVRQRLREEVIIVAALGVLFFMGLLATWGGGLGSAALLFLTVGVTAGTAKLAFDSIVQRDAPNTNYGRSFAIFETRFQIFWVVGAFIPVVIPINLRVGYFLIALAALAAYVLFIRNRQRPNSPSWGFNPRGLFGPATDQGHQPQQG